MKELKNIEFKNSLNTLCKESTLVKQTVGNVKAKFDDEKLNSLKDDLQLLIDICIHIEDSVSDKNKSKINKKDVVLAVYSKLYNLDELDIHKISSWIDTAHSNGVIKKTNFFLKILKMFLNLFSRNRK